MKLPPPSINLQGRPPTVFVDILTDLPGGFIELDLTRIHDTVLATEVDQPAPVSAS